MKAQDIRKIAVAGAGTMGASMAQIFAKYGYTVVLYDIAEAALERGRNLVKVNQESQIAAGEDCRDIYFVISISELSEFANTYIVYSEIYCFFGLGMCQMSVGGTGFGMLTDKSQRINLIVHYRKIHSSPL
jgi:hypothetical protein